jgi:ATP-dependent exoDNAse (exonuclease V) alpha subunit
MPQRWWVLRRRNEGGEEEGENIVMIPGMGLDVNKEEYLIPLRRLQFPVRVGYAMTINKAQGQSVKHVELDL